MDDFVFEVVLCGDVGADVAEGVVEGYVPRHGEVGVGTHEEGRVVVVGGLHDGGYDLLALRFAGFLVFVFVGVEGVVVDAVGDLGAPGGVVALEELFLTGDFPDELVVFATFIVDIVGAEGTGVVEDKVFEEGGAAGDGEVGPAEGVAGKVVAHGEVEVFEEGDFAGAGNGVLGVGDFHFEVVADAEVETAGLSVGGAAVEALLKDGVAMDVASIVGVGLPPAEGGFAKVGMVAEGDGGVDNVADGFDRAEAEVEHAVDAGGEGGVEADLAVATETADGVDGDGVGGGVERFADGGPVPAFVVGGGVCPVELFEHFEGEGERNGVLDAVLHALEGLELEEVGVLGVDVVVGSEGVGEGEVLVPAEPPGGFFPTEGIEGGGTEGEGGKFQVEEAGLGVVGFAEGGSEVEGAAQLGGVGDGGGGGAVEVVVAVGGVFVVVAALEVDVGRKAAAGVGFVVLIVLPGYFEVAVFAEGVAVAGDAFFGDAVADVEVAFVLVADIVVATSLGGPAEVGV